MRIFEVLFEKVYVDTLRIICKKGGDDADNDKSSDNKNISHM